MAIYGLHEQKADLEQLFFQLTNGQFAAPPPQTPQPYGPSGYQGYAVPTQQPAQQPGPWGGNA